MAAFLEPLHAFFRWLLQASWQGTVLIGLVVVIQWVFRKVLPPQWRYVLWLLVVIRLALPFSLDSVFSIYNYANVELPARQLKRAVYPKARGAGLGRFNDTFNTSSGLWS